MTMVQRVGALAGLMLIVPCVQGAELNQKLEYEQRSAARYLSLFQSLDRNADGNVARLEACGDINFLPSFNDVDINRDDLATKAELQRFIGQRYSVRTQSGRHP